MKQLFKKDFFLAKNAALIIVFFAGLVSAMAQTPISVSNNTELNTALTTVANGGVIVFTNNIVITAEISTNKTFTLNGNGYTLTVPVPGMNTQGKVNSAASTFRVLNLTSGANITVNNLTLKGGKAISEGGAIRVNTGATIRLNSCTISDSASNPVASGCSGAGGGIAVYGTAYLYDCFIKRNAATYAGGILVRLGVMYMDKTTVSDNRTTSLCGGGGAEIQGTVYINNSTFSNNTGNQGGSLQAGGANGAGIIYIMNSSFTGNVNRTNSLDDAALAIYTGDSKIYAVNCVFAHNYAGNNGSNPSSFVLKDAGNYSSSSGSTIQVVHSVIHQPSNTMSSGVTQSNNVFYTGDINGSNNTIFSGGILSNVLNNTGDEVGTIQVYRPFLYSANSATAPALKTGSFLSQSVNKGVQTRFNHNNNSNPVFSYYNGSSWVQFGAAAVGSVSDLVTLDQSGVTRTDPPTRGAVEAEISNLYYVKVNGSADGTVNGGTIYGDVYPSGTQVTLTAIANSSKSFLRWDYVAGGTGTASTANPYTFTVTQDVTLKPIFSTLSAGQYTITYVGNENTGGNAPAGGTFSASTTIASVGSLTRSGYSFTGWNTNANGSGTNYAAGASYSGGATITLYAQWQKLLSSISTSGTSMSAFTKCSGSTSATQTFTVSGSNLTANIIIGILSGYEYATTAGGTYSSILTLTQTSGTVASTAIYVRLTSASTGNPAGNITLTSSGATAVNVAASGIVTTTIPPTATSQIIFAGATVADLVATGTDIKWYAAATGGTALATTTALARGMYYASQTLNGCESERTAVEVSIENTTWNGSAWSNGTPNSSLEAIINGNYNSSVVGSGFTAKKLTINSGKILTLYAPHCLVVTNEVINNAGENGLVIESGASLIQVNNVQNSGSVTVKRDSNPLYRLDYTMWSSPVTNGNQFLTNFSPFTSNTGPKNIRFYTYDSGINLFTSITNASSAPFELAKGYLIRMPNENPASLGTGTPYYTGSTPIIFKGKFTGILNNGNVSLTGLATGSYSSVGNPYPSAIDSDKFLDAGNASGGVLYFWRNRNIVPGTSYATYTKAGATANGGYTPNGIIGLGQGFVTTASASGTITFTNAMRTCNVANFLRTKAGAEKDRIWINLLKGTDVINQILLAYMDGATTGVDFGIDGKYINDSPMALTSNIDNQEYIIQGRPEFTDTDEVLLNFKTDVAGDYTIAKDNVEGLFANGQAVYLVDALTGLETNLQNNSYTFTTAIGTFNNRFKLIYKSSVALNVDSLVLDQNSISVYKQSNVIHINAGTITMKNVKVFDIAGRLVLEQKEVNATTTTLKNLAVANQVLLVKITTKNNKVVTKKVIF